MCESQEYTGKYAALAFLIVPLVCGVSFKLLILTTSSLKSGLSIGSGFQQDFIISYLKLHTVSLYIITDRNTLKYTINKNLKI